MDNHQPQTTDSTASPEDGKKKTKLPRVGCLMMLAGAVLSSVLGATARSTITEGAAVPPLARIMFLFAELSGLLTFVGLAVLIIGLLRSAKKK